MLAFDIGGTFIKYAVISNNQEVLEKGKFATPDGKEISKALANKFNELQVLLKLRELGYRQQVLLIQRQV